MKKVMALLDAENAIIRRGDLEGLPNLAQQKELLMRDLEQIQVSAVDLMALQKAAERNAQLLIAAMAGVKEAQTRLAALDEMRAGLNIYTADGARKTVPTNRNGLERKA